MHLPVGTLLKNGDYRIEKVLGQGGFGITYLAEQTGLGRKVALKEFFMQEHCNRDADTAQVSVPSDGSRKLVERFRQKFLKEARLIASFDNGNIIKIFDVFEENGTAYYVMEYLEGKSLKAMVEEGGALAESTALKYIRQVADALREIHSHNLLHLDVKPANIMLNRKGQAVLIDFGISKHYDEGGHQTSSALIGTSEGYAPLEQYEAGALDSFTPATDIYALGATLFFLLTGIRPPKAGDVMNDGLPVLPQEISPAVRNAIDVAMQPRRKDRPQSIADFLALLGGVAPRTGGAAVPGMAAEPMAFANDAATEISPVHDVLPAPSRQTPPPAVEAPRRDAPAPERKSSDNRSGTPKKSKAPLILLLLLFVAVIAGGAWYITNVSGGNDNGANGGNAMKETAVDDVVLERDRDGNDNGANGGTAMKDTVVDDVVLERYSGRNGKYGFIDKSGNVVVPCKYGNAWSFSEGLVAVELDGKWGFIDQSGNEVIPCKYGNAWSFSEGLAAVELDGKWGFIDKSGNVVVPCKYHAARSFSEGLAAVRIGGWETGKWGFIDKSGNEVIPCKYDGAGSFSEGLAVVELDYYWGSIDKSGNVVIPCKYDNEYRFSEGLAVVKFDGKYGFIDKSGNLVIPFKYDYANDFSEGLAHVGLDGRYFYIDKSGNETK
ncbi:MAG: WG repeat-containing protein [Bacteroidaceae bacterium]|nr:WG repeat-containing protein [Bacteroidaceae bacterium]